MASSPAKKRKLDTEDASANDQITISLPNFNASKVGPVLAGFPSVRPSKNVPFECYRLPAGGNEAEFDFATSPMLVAGENATIEYESTPESQVGDSGSRYLLGVYNKRMNQVSFRQAPLHIITCQVKKLKRTEPIPVTNEQFNEAKNRLGTAFGTKKAIKAIRAAERNRVDVAAMESVQAILQDSIQTNTSNLPSKEEAKLAANENRLIPPFNADALAPEDIYSVNDIIPEAEYKAIQSSEFLSASAEEGKAQLPFKRSNWVNQHFVSVFSSPKPSKKILRMLYYVSAMIAFRSATFRLDDKEAMYNRLSGVPTVIIDGLLARFTETPRGSSKPRFTSQNETTLMTHMFALCLHVDNFYTDTAVIAKDLSLPITKINSLFKTLGCKMHAMKENDVRKLGLPDTTVGTKRAVLKVPLEFPKPPARRRN